MILKEKPLPQTPGKELRGAGQAQTIGVRIIRGETLMSSDGKDQSKQPNHRFKKKWAQKGQALSKRSLAASDHLRILSAELDEALQAGTRPSRLEVEEEHIIKTSGQARGTGTRCQRARRRRRVRL